MEPNKLQTIAEDLMRYSGRVREQRDHGEVTQLMDDRRGTQMAVAGALNGDEPDWWLQIGESDSMLLAFADVAAVARSPEAGVVEFELIGSLAGGSYSEQWRDENGTLMFTHERLPGSVTIRIGRYPVEPSTRATLRRWAKLPRPT
jgi:hypothetical protein